jgi:hypothetical protein
VIYFLQDGECGRVKIGYTANMAGRYPNAVPGNRRPIVLGVMEGTLDDELALHCRFASIALRGEMFRPTDELLTFIRSVTQPWEPPPPKQKPVADPSKGTVIRFRARSEYVAYLKRWASEEGISVSALIEQSLIALAEHEGEPELPPRQV